MILLQGDFTSIRGRFLLLKGGRSPASGERKHVSSGRLAARAARSEVVLSARDGELQREGLCAVAALLLFERIRTESPLRGGRSGFSRSTYGPTAEATVSRAINVSPLLGPRSDHLALGLRP
jgi:hypothetical protein